MATRSIEIEELHVCMGGGGGVIPDIVVVGVDTNALYYHNYGDQYNWASCDDLRRIFCTDHLHVPMPGTYT